MCGLWWPGKNVISWCQDGHTENSTKIQWKIRTWWAWGLTPTSSLWIELNNVIPITLQDLISEFTWNIIELLETNNICVSKAPPMPCWLLLKMLINDIFVRKLVTCPMMRHCRKVNARCRSSVATLGCSRSWIAVHNTSTAFWNSKHKSLRWH